MTQENEIWKKVSELPGMEEFREEYEISNFGRLKLLSGKISKKKSNNRGYICLTLMTKDGKRRDIRLHRLVALAFCEGYEEDLVVNHRDENKTNNHFENLEWITQKQNCNHGTRNERVGETQSMPVEALDPETLDCVLVFKSTVHAHEFGFTQQAVSNACRGIYNPQGKHGGTNKYKGYLWRYA